jgi:hypothetical protein
MPRHDLMSQVTNAGDLPLLWRIPKTERGPISPTKPSLILHRRGDSDGQITPFLETHPLSHVIRHRPLIVLSLVASGSRRPGPWCACWSDPSRNACPILISRNSPKQLGMVSPELPPLNASELAPNSANGLIPSLIAWAKSQPPGNVAIVSFYGVNSRVGTTRMSDE